MDTTPTAATAAPAMRAGVGIDVRALSIPLDLLPVRSKPSANSLVLAFTVPSGPGSLPRMLPSMLTLPPLFSAALPTFVAAVSVLASSPSAAVAPPPMPPARAAPPAAPASATPVPATAASAEKSRIATLAASSDARNSEVLASSVATTGSRTGMVTSGLLPASRSWLRYRCRLF